MFSHGVRVGREVILWEIVTFNLNFYGTGIQELCDETATGRRLGGSDYM